MTQDLVMTCKEVLIHHRCRTKIKKAFNLWTPVRYAAFATIYLNIAIFLGGLFSIPSWIRAGWWMLIGVGRTRPRSDRSTKRSRPSLTAWPTSNKGYWSKRTWSINLPSTMYEWRTQPALQHKAMRHVKETDESKAHRQSISILNKYKI